jgi:hypothetical protein
MFHHTGNWALTSQPLITIYTSSLLWNLKPSNCFFRSPNCISSCFVWTVKWWYLITCQEPSFYWSGIFKAIHQQNKWATVNAIMNTHLNFMAKETVFIKNPSYNRHLKVSITHQIYFETYKSGGIWSSHNGADKCNHPIYRKKISRYFWQKNNMLYLGEGDPSNTTICYTQFNMMLRQHVVVFDGSPYPIYTYTVGMVPLKHALLRWHCQLILQPLSTLYQHNLLHLQGLHQTGILHIL